MAEKGQTEANCNLKNTNRIANEVGESREEEKGNSHIGHAKDFQNAEDRYERDLKISREVETGQENEERTVILATPITVLEISREP